MSLYLSNCRFGSSSSSFSRRQSVRSSNGGGIRARWSFRSKFGEQSQASALMQEWVNEFAIPGGADNVEVRESDYGTEMRMLVVQALPLLSFLPGCKSHFSFCCPGTRWVDRQRFHRSKPDFRFAIGAGDFLRFNFTRPVKKGRGRGQH